MGAQSTATTARSTMLNGTGASHGVSGPWDMDGEVVAASAAQVGEAVGEEEAQASTEDQRAEETTGRAGPAQMKASRVGALLTEVSSAVQGVVKASTAFRPIPKEAARGPGSAGTEGTARTSGSGYVTAISEGDAVDLAGRGGASFPGGSGRLFSSEQAMRLENMAKAAPLIYPEAQAVPPELPHSAFLTGFRLLQGAHGASAATGAFRRWEALQAAKQTECAKRIALFKGMILELQARAKSFMEQETKLQSLIQLGWVKKQDQREPMWQPLIWSVEQQKDIPCLDMGPLPHGKALHAMEMLIEHTNGQVIHRFHATRPLAQEYAGDMLEFKLEAGGYSDAGLGRGRGVVEALLGGAVGRLTRVFAWSSVLLDWSRPQLQHDVGAFASRALAKLRSPLMCGEWQSRREDPDLRVLDTGLLHIPITMEIPDGSHTLQDCIEAWKLQHSIHAMCSAPDMLVLQLGRFRQNAASIDVS
eukprot:s1344_g2.t1